MVSYFFNLLNISRLGYYNYLNTLDKKEDRELKYLEAKNNILKASKYKDYKKGFR